jgi:hypothetical protein
MSLSVHPAPTQWLEAAASGGYVPARGWMRNTSYERCAGNKKGLMAVRGVCRSWRNPILGAYGFERHMNPDRVSALPRWITGVCRAARRRAGLRIGMRLCRGARSPLVASQAPIEMAPSPNRDAASRYLASIFIFMHKKVLLDQCKRNVCEMISEMLVYTPSKTHGPLRDAELVENNVIPLPEICLRSCFFSYFWVSCKILAIAYMVVEPVNLIMYISLHLS